MPIFLNGVARACLLMGYVKAAIKPAQIVERYVPQLQALSDAITSGVAELRLKRRESQRTNKRARSAGGPPAAARGSRAAAAR